MSDEEKEAIETVKFLKEKKWYLHAFDRGKEILSEEEKQDIDIVLNLLEKQQKEIEDLKFKYQARKDRTSKELEDLKDIQQQICNEELITQEYVKENYIHKNTIKAKIEELEERADEDNLDDFIKINVLQMILEEKE